jgi:hypothetical protein
MSDKMQATRNIYKAIDNSKNSVTHISEAHVDAVSRAKKKVKLTLLPDLEQLGWVRLYMLSANGSYSSGQLPEVDSTVLVVFPRGQRENGICIAGGIIEDGESGSTLNGDYDLMFEDKFGNKVHIRQDKIKIEHDTKIEVDAPLIVLNGGTKAVARVGDTVLTPVGNGLIDPLSGNNTILA